MDHYKIKWRISSCDNCNQNLLSYVSSCHIFLSRSFALSLRISSLFSLSLSSSRRDHAIRPSRQWWHEVDRCWSELTRKSPYSWWTRWLRQTLRLRRMSPCTEEQKRTPWDFAVEVYLWHGRNHPCPIWALAPRPTLLWLPMWDISIPFKRLHDRCRHLSAYNCNFLPLYIIPSLKPNCEQKADLTVDAICGWLFFL